MSKKIGVIKMTNNNTKSVKKTLVTLLCATALFSVANMSGTKAEEAVNPNAVETTTKPTPAVVPATDTVETGKTGEAPVVPVPSTTENNPVVPAIPNTETKPSDATKPEETKPSETPKPEEVKPEEDKKPEEKKPEEAKPEEDKKPEEKKPEEVKPENKQDNTHLPLVDPTLPNTKPVETNKGTVTGTENGKVIIKDSTTGQERKVAPEELGGKVEKDGTVTIKEKDGKLTRLPNTGVETSVGLLALGVALLTSGFGLMKKPRKN